MMDLFIIENILLQHEILELFDLAKFGFDQSIICSDSMKVFWDRMQTLRFIEGTPSVSNHYNSIIFIMNHDHINYSSAILMMRLIDCCLMSIIQSSWL